MLAELFLVWLSFQSLGAIFQAAKCIFLKAEEKTNFEMNFSE